MNIFYHFKKARSIIGKLDAEKLSAVKGICRNIQIAQDRFNEEGHPYFTKCIESCKGLCCKNIDIDEIIDFRDFTFILTIRPELEPTIASCLEKKSHFLYGDCIFLLNGEGPCMFPSDLKPYICITTFCYDVRSCVPNIRAIRKGFRKLGWYLFRARFF